MVNKIENLGDTRVEEVEMHRFQFCFCIKNRKEIPI